MKAPASHAPFFGLTWVARMVQHVIFVISATVALKEGVQKRRESFVP